MAQQAVEQATTARHPRGRKKIGQDGLFAALMSGPAVLGIIVFLVVPFFLAFLLSFTDQRLLSPNPTEWVGRHPTG